MKNQIKELRVKIDGLAQLTKELKPLKTPACIDATYTTSKRPDINSKETEKAYDSIIFTKAWLGKVLLELGDTNPYAKSYGNRKTIKDIEPTADVAKTEINTPDGKRWFYHADLVLKDWSEQGKSHIEKVDWLRQEIEDISYSLRYIAVSIPSHHSQKPSRELSIARTNAYNYACEARMWLGFELARVREETKN